MDLKAAQITFSMKGIGGDHMTLVPPRITSLVGAPENAAMGARHWSIRVTLPAVPISTS